MLLENMKLLVISVVLCLIAIIFILNLFGLICPGELVAHSIGEPLIVKRDSDYLCTGISQIVTDGNHVYVLFGQYSVVQVYSSEGEYEYTISVYNHSNGRTKIAAANDRLYLCDKLNNVYIIKNGRLDTYIDRSDSKQLRAQLPFGASSKEYMVYFGSVWYAPEGKLTRCLIQRPSWLSVYQNNLLSLGLFLLVFLVGVVIMSQTLSVRYKNHR